MGRRSSAPGREQSGAERLSAEDRGSGRVRSRQRGPVGPPPPADRGRAGQRRGRHRRARPLPGAGVGLAGSLVSACQRRGAGAVGRGAGRGVGLRKVDAGKGAGGGGAAGWRQIGDDLLPVRSDGEAGRALPRFPQPNLPLQSQWGPPAPAEVDLAAVYLLEPEGGAVEIHQLTRRRAVLALVGQTVAARLFDAELQGRLLDFCAELARCLPVRGLRYPRRLEALPSMTAAIAADLGAW